MVWFRIWASFGAILLTLTGFSLLRAHDIAVTLLLGLAAVLAFVIGIPTRSDDALVRQLMLLTPQGIIIRCPWGLANWDYDEIQHVASYSVYGQLQMVVEDRRGREHLIDCDLFEHTDKIVDRVRERMAHARLVAEEAGQVDEAQDGPVARPETEDPSALQAA